MAKWAKGKSGNPNGRPKLDEEVKTLRKLTIEQVITVFSKYLGMTLSEMSEVNREELSLLELWLLKAAETGMRTGNYFTLDKILDRVVGKTTVGINSNTVEQSSDLEDDVLKEGNNADKIDLMDFESCCKACGYAKPYAKQVEMAEFIFDETNEPRMLLGARRYGKTDYCVIVKSAQMIALYQTTIILVTKEQGRAWELALEIGRCLECLGVKEFLRKSSNLIILKAKKQSFEEQSSKEQSSKQSSEQSSELSSNNNNKEPNLKAISINSKGFRGRHPEYILLDDPVTPEASSRADREKAKKVYDELLKLTQRVRILGQPVHKKDLYQLTRTKIKTMEAPYGTIPELDIDLEVLRLAGVDEASINASYFLKIDDISSMPFADIEITDAKIDVSEGTMCSIDPSHEGGDYTAITIAKVHLERILVVGFCFKRAWYDCLEEISGIIKRYNVKVGYFENNALGQEPVRQLNRLNLECRFVGFKSLDNKEAKIQNAGMYVNTLILSKESNADYVSQIIDYEAGAGHDDAPDSLANWLINSGWMKAVREGSQRQRH